LSLIQYCIQNRAYLLEQRAVLLSEDKLNNGARRAHIVDLVILIARYDNLIAQFSKRQAT
jgi:hypothetical protein